MKAPILDDDGFARAAGAGPGRRPRGGHHRRRDRRPRREPASDRWQPGDGGGEAGQVRQPQQLRAAERRPAGAAEQHRGAARRPAARPSSPSPSPASARAPSPRRWAAAAGERSGSHGSATPSQRRRGVGGGEQRATSGTAAGQHHRPAAAEHPRQLRGEQLRGALPAGASASSSSSSRWVSSGPAKGRSDSTWTPGTAGAAVIRLSATRSAGSSTTTSSTATPLPRSSTSTRDDVDAGVAQRGRDRAEDAGPVGYDQPQEIGHGSSGAVLVRADRRRSRAPTASRDPRRR